MGSSPRRDRATSRLEDIQASLKTPTGRQTGSSRSISPSSRKSACWSGGSEESRPGSRSSVPKDMDGTPGSGGRLTWSSKDELSPPSRQAPPPFERNSRSFGEKTVRLGGQRQAFAGEVVARLDGERDLAQRRYEQLQIEVEGLQRQNAGFEGRGAEAEALSMALESRFGSLEEAARHGIEQGNRLGERLGELEGLGAEPHELREEFEQFREQNHSHLQVANSRARSTDRTCSLSDGAILDPADHRRSLGTSSSAWSRGIGRARVLTPRGRAGHRRSSG